MLLFYVGGETGVGGWITTYLQQTFVLETATSALMAGGFWAAITGGRVIGALVGTRLGGPRLLLGSLVGALAGALLLVLSAGDLRLSLAGVVVIGVSFGPIFPTTLAIVTSLFPRAPGTAASIASATGSLGGTLLPWTQGNLMEYYGRPPAWCWCWARLSQCCCLRWCAGC